jgi:hypothetical protein
MIAIAIMLLVAIASIVICHRVAKQRGADPVFWGVMAALFGPLAVPFVFFSKRRP